MTQTVCIHGDGGHALTFARRLRAALEARNIRIGWHCLSLRFNPAALFVVRIGEATQKWLNL